MFPVDAVLDALVLEPVAPDRYHARNAAWGGPVVHGGQLLAQSVVAGLIGQEGKTVKTLHTVFARGARPDVPLDVSVDRLHTGRSLASSSVTISQGERLCARSTVLLSAEEPDLISHADRRSVPPEPTGGADPNGRPTSWQITILGGVDISDPEAVGPPELDVWTRWPGAPADPVTNQALLALSTDNFLIGTAMRPHRGVGQAQAHKTISTGVLSHTITFHEPFAAKDWLLLAHRSTYAGHGRGYGRGDVYRANGDLVASFVQDSMIRAMSTSGARSL